MAVCICVGRLITYVAVCVYVYVNGNVMERKKAHLSQRALEPSRGQSAVRVLANEELGLANQPSFLLKTALSENQSNTEGSVKRRAELMSVVSPAEG